MANPAYVELEARYRRVALLGETSAILHWDTAAIMPEGAASRRSRWEEGQEDRGARGTRQPCVSRSPRQACVAEAWPSQQYLVTTSVGRASIHDV